MRLRYRRSVKAGPFRINIGKRGISSISAGSKHARMRVGKRGTSVGGSLGHGLSWEHRLDESRRAAVPAPAPRRRSCSGIIVPLLIMVGVLFLLAIVF